MTIKYFNVKNGLSTGNILLHASNSSVVASTFTGNIVATNSANLGAVGNLIITGGSANYVLTTDGAGNLSWAAQTGGGGGTYSNTNVAAYLPTYSGNLTAGNANISGSLVANTITTGSGSGNISGANYVIGNYFSGNGSLLTSLTGANVTGYVPNANIANTATSATTAGTVTTAAQPNITSVGNLTTLTVTGNVNANYFIGNGSQLTGLPASYSNANVAAYLPTYTGNLTAGNANISGSLVAGTITTGSGTGNISGANYVVANYFSGNGSLLTSITGANVTGYVPLATAANTAGTVTTAAQPNITSVGTLTGLTVSGLLVATGTGIKTANIQDTTGTITITTNYSNIAGDVGVYGNLTVGTSGSGNVTASYFIGNGSQLTGISASSSNTANTAGTVTTNAQPNITSTGTLTSLTVSGNVDLSGANVSLGSVSNLHITGGTANYVLATDGSGSLSWVAQSGGSGLNTITVDNFTGNGVQTTFTLSTTPTSINQTTVNYNGTVQLRSVYTLSGANLTFTSAPANGSYIEVTSTEFLATGQGSFVTRNYTGNGVQNTFTVTSGVTASSVLVAENGVLQVPTTDYTVSGADLIFTSAPANAVAIQVRELAVAVASGGGSGGTTRAQAMTMGIIFGG